MNNIPIYIINCNNELRKKRMIDRFKHVNLIPTFNCFTNISDIDLAEGDDNATISVTGSLSGTLKGGEGKDDLFLM